MDGAVSEKRLSSYGDRWFESPSLQERVERTAIACPQPIARPKVADAGEDRVGRWIDRGSIWRTSTPRSGRMPRRLTSSMSRCSATSTHTGTAAELAGKPEYLCPALIHRPNHSAVQPFRLIGTCAGLRPKIPELVFDTTFRSRCRPTRGCLVGKRESAPIPAGCSEQAPLAGEADLRFGAAVEASISDFSLGRPI